ncbi:MAG: TonB-dependent receptor, partial [Bryobacteraceae bacterium]|nr:TonB-dependent receptor [Bryobacteraceae bacterium]
MTVFRLFAQSTGSITGNLVDSSGAAVQNAPVQLLDENRQFNVTTRSDSEGRFAFSAVQPGRYTIEVKQSGFKTFDRRDIVVQANDRIALGDIRLEVGAVTETVQVTGEAVLLKTESAERSDVLVTKQLENIAVNGRSYLALVTLTPGVVSNANFQVAGTGGLGGISANGTRYNQNQLTLNGISNVDTGNNGDQLSTVSLDSVQEYRILSGTYQAEYGRSAGAQISVVTKSGTSGFHGSGYYYRRHDSMNANSWIRNRDGLPRQLYRFQNPGYTIGGPAYIPKLFNRDKDKLFFFFSQEYQRQLQPEGQRTVTVPTALERQGDFSQSLDNSGRPFPFIRDPLSAQPCSATNTAGCFASGGVLGRIPQNRLYQPGLALLNFFPLPNRDQRQFLNNNYLSQISTRRPRREDLLRLDANISDRVRTFFHYINNENSFTSPYGSFVLGTNLGVIPITDARPGKSFGGGVTWVIDPTTTLETTVGWGRNDINIDLADGGGALTRATTGQNFPLLYPSAVQKDFIPSFGFNGTRLANSPTIGTNNAPFVNYNDTLDIISNASKVFEGHLVKAGIYIQKSRKDQTSFANANGNYNWGDNPNNPLDTGFGYSNAAIGVYNTFQQAGRYANGQYRYYNIEWFAQDTWKLTRRFTLDYGLRMAWYQPQHDAGLIVSSFSPQAFDPNRAPRLFQPGRDALGNQIAIDPVSGRTEGSFAVGRLVPDSGDLLNGIIQPKKQVNKYLQRDRGIQWAPRLGFGWDILGNQSMVLRGGAGIYYDRFQGNRVFDLLTNPPTVVQPQLSFGFARDIDPATALVGPPSLVMADPTAVLPTVYNYSMGLQNKLPFDMV